MDPRRILLLSLALVGGCSDAGGQNGTLTRWVAQPPGMVSRVAADVLLEERFQIKSDVHREGGGKIEARESAPSRREVVVRFEEVEPGHTLVRIDPPRHERRFGEELLDRIMVRVGEESERVPPYVRTSTQGSYEGTLEEALAALDATLERIDASVIDRVVQTWGARIEAYAPDDTLYEIAIVVPDAGPLDILFAASTDSKERADQRAEQVKSEFTRALASQR